MIYGGVPVNSMKVKHYELNTNDCDMIASDLQAGKTAVARGKKITGTGKSFEFAQYGTLKTNVGRYVPSEINIIEIASSNYPIKLKVNLMDLILLDYSISQNIASVIIDNIEYDLYVSVVSNILKITCDKTFDLQVFYGKDRYT